MKKNVDIAKLDPVVKIAPGEKLKQGKKFSLTAKRKRKLNVKYVMLKIKKKHDLCHKIRLQRRQCAM